LAIINNMSKLSPCWIEKFSCYHYTKSNYTILDFWSVKFLRSTIVDYGMYIQQLDTLWTIVNEGFLKFRVRLISHENWLSEQLLRPSDIHRISIINDYVNVVDVIIDDTNEFFTQLTKEYKIQIFHKSSKANDWFLCLKLFFLDEIKKIEARIDYLNQEI
jgi:hypothetical protein